MSNHLRIKSSSIDSSVYGKVNWSPIKSIWFNFHLFVAIGIAPFLFSWSAFIIFLFTTVITLCLGHSIGMHRLMIHRSFECPMWLEYILVYLGVLVGLSGPIGLMHQHDLRDWAQKLPSCHSFLKHGEKIAKDAWWQLNCDLKFKSPPIFIVENRVCRSWFYNFLEKTWMLQNLIFGLFLFNFGGLAFVAWGVSVRIVVSVGGHWLVGYFAHNHGQKTWVVKGAAVQGHNIKIAGFLSMGEAWNNNHHAFPESARIGLSSKEPDPGWWMILILEKLGLIKNIKLPSNLPLQANLVKLSNESCNKYV